MTINKIRDEKLQYDINRKSAKISALSSGNINKYEYLTGEEILAWGMLPRVIEQARGQTSKSNWRAWKTIG